MTIRVALTLLALAAAAAAATPTRLAVTPERAALFGRGAEQRLVVQAHFADGTWREVTAEAAFGSSVPEVASVRPDGVVEALSSGETHIGVSYAGLTANVPTRVEQGERPLTPTFDAEVMAVFTKVGCSGGGCHGSLKGQAGFKLSLFGYDPVADHPMITCEDGGRRIDLDSPENSLLLRKPTFQEAHGGGQLLQVDSPEYRILLDWIRAGARRDPARDRRLTSLEVLPAETVLFGKGSSLHLLVRGRFSDGSEADVTHLVNFSSNNELVATVDKQGRVTAERGGETAILVRGPGLVSVARIGVITERREVPPVVSDNFIDKYVFGKLGELSIPPSPPADDATFLRRAYLDVIGLIPTAEEARRFLADDYPNKRAKLVDELLERPEYADYWALYWGDHLNNTKQLLYNKGPYQFTQWLYTAFRENWAYDKFVRELLTSSGNMYDNPATSYYPLMKKELDMAAMTSQLFLGVSIDCARCHNHPLESWTQADYNGMAAFFSQVRYKGGAGPRNNERILYVKFDREFEHPDTGKPYEPKALGGPVFDDSGRVDRREKLFEWMTANDNPFFAKAIVNRYWKQFMGRGIVDPVDDFRVTNPPTNEPLLEALAEDFVEHDYDLHHLIRQITSSQAYQLSSTPTGGNREDVTAHSRYYPKRLTAEQMLDSISQATGVPEEFAWLYPGTRASQLPEPEIESYFLDVFDRPSRQLVCDRKTTNSLNQALHLVSGEAIDGKVKSPRATLARLLDSARSDGEIVEELYLGALSRYPDAEERRLATQALERAGDRRRGFEDFYWALLNSKEFVFNH